MCRCVDVQAWRCAEMCGCADVLRAMRGCVDVGMCGGVMRDVSMCG